MDKDQLISNLVYLVNKYIDDENTKIQLLKSTIDPKAKYVLGEIERHKNADYTKDDKEIIKDIYFYFC